MSRPTRVLPAAALLLLTGCASIVNGPTQAVGVSSEPSGAAVSVDGVAIGRTPLVAEIARDRGHVVRLSAPPHPPRELTLSRSISPWALGNLLFGGFGLIGIGVDAATGGLYHLHPPVLDVDLASGGRRAEDALPTLGADASPEPSIASDALVGASPESSPDVPDEPSTTGGRVYLGASAVISSVVPLPLPHVEVGYRRDRVDVRLRAPLVLIGRFSLEAGYAIDEARRTFAQAVAGVDSVLFNGYEFVGLGVERTFGDRDDWFVQLDATVGRYERGRYGGEDDESDDRLAAVALSVGLRRR